MAHILHSVSVPTTVPVEQPDGQGGTATVEQTRNLVSSVTFMIDKDTPHTLTFYPKGTILKDGSGREYVVGDDHHPYIEFDDPAEAVQAYLDGKVA